MLAGSVLTTIAILAAYRYLKPVREVFEKHVGPRPTKPPKK